MAPITAASIRNGIDPFDNDESFGCCGCRCGERCVIFTKHFLLPLLGGLIYAATIAADINVVVGDYLTGNIIYAAVTFGLVFVPSLFFSLYMFVYTIGNNTGFLAGFLSITWILLFPVMPLWPIIRSLIQMVKALVTICGKKEKLYERNNQLSKKSSSHLLKFLQAFTASAPQLVVRLHKLAAINPDKPFASISVAEIVQISVGLFSLSMAVVSTYNKSVDTSGVKRGKLAFHKLSCGASLLALLWWFSFLAARLPCIALFIHVFEYWSVVLLLLHCIFIFAMQTTLRSNNVLKNVVVHLFSGFIFIFAYLHFNMTSRSSSYWLPYVLFTLLAFFEQTAMIAVWVLVKRDFIPYIPMIPASVFSSSTNDTILSQYDINLSDYDMTTADPGQYFGVLDHDYLLVSIHFGLFLISIVFMTITLCCVRKDENDYDSDDSYSSY